MARTLIFLLFPLSIFAQELVCSFTLDTSVYSNPGAWGIRGPGSERSFPLNEPSSPSTDIIGCFNKNGTDQWDIYSFSGKTGSAVVPSSATPNGFARNYVFFSQFFINSDSNWECLVNYSENKPFQPKHQFILFDHSGNQLLSDNGTAYFGFDGLNTYVYASSGNLNYLADFTFSYKVWRFRTNISSSSPKLSKSQVSTPGLMKIYGQENGNYRVTLSPSSGNQVRFQMFDLLGRCVFSKQINNITSPQTFTIPEANVPKSPFVAKVTDGNGSVCRKITNY
jgi:hypothetical protein